MILSQTIWFKCFLKDDNPCHKNKLPIIEKMFLVIIIKILFQKFSYFNTKKINCYRWKYLFCSNAQHEKYTQEITPHLEGNYIWKSQEIFLILVKPWISSKRIIWFPGKIPAKNAWYKTRERDKLYLCFLLRIMLKFKLTLEMQLICTSLVVITAI